MFINTPYEEKYRGFTIKVEDDPEPNDPREWDNLGTMICAHRRYILGDAVRLFSKPDRFLEIRYNEESGEVTFHDPAAGKDYRYDSIKTEIALVRDCVIYNRWKDECK